MILHLYLLCCLCMSTESHYMNRVCMLSYCACGAAHHICKTYLELSIFYFHPCKSYKCLYVWSIKLCSILLIVIFLMYSMLIERVCNAGAMRKETLHVKFAMRLVFFSVHTNCTRFIFVLIQILNSMLIYIQSRTATPVFPLKFFPCVVTCWLHASQ